jgi:cytoskeletal protein CcmA (bactofilin family)
MDMFHSKAAAEPAPDIEAGNRSGYRKPIQHSVIGADLTITGDLVSTGDIKVDGRVDGNITCRTLTLGDEPLLNSEIAAETVRICGTFNGQVRANKVVLTRNAKVSADIAQEVLEIEPGATLEGNVRRLGPSKPNGAS